MQSLKMKVSLQNVEFAVHGLMCIYGSTTYPELDAEMDLAVENIKQHMNQC